jgi:hypothetical protein
MKLLASYNCLSGQTYPGSQNRSLSNGHDRLRLTTPLTRSIILLHLRVALALICNTMRPLRQSMHGVPSLLWERIWWASCQWCLNLRRQLQGPPLHSQRYITDCSARHGGSWDSGSTPAWRGRCEGGKILPVSKQHTVKICSSLYYYIITLIY